MSAHLDPVDPEDEDGGDKPRRSNFIRDVIDADLAAGRYGGKVITRFPPEPNGYMHIGHAKAIQVNFGIAQDYGGHCNLRFDDTNPVTEDTRFVRVIEEDIRWLGFDWGGEALFASDYFERMYEYALDLIRKGFAYVDSLSKEEMAAYRGTITEPGRNSPHRDRSVEENLDLFTRMRAGEFPDGTHLLRAKIDMTSPNMLLRDPPLYRIRHAHHHRTGDAWCIYPMYDYAHSLEDAFEGVSHSLCSLEFETHRPLYDWVLDPVEWERRPKQIEFARLALSNTVMSKRYFRRLVDEGHVDGWDDPRMSTLRGLRRRGVTPEAIRAFCDMVGVAKANSLVDLGKFEYCVREDLNHRSPRVMCVLRPLKVVITNYPEDGEESIDASYWPHDVPREGSRPVPFSREVLIEREDFAEDPPKQWFRLAPGREVRLRYAYVIRCDEVVHDESGEVVELRCTYDAATRDAAPVGRKVKGTIHWVSAAHSLPCEVRLVDRLFLPEKPGSDPDLSFTDELNPESMTYRPDARIEPSVRDEAPGSRYQFERTGYFVSDTQDSSAENLVFIRTVTLKDAWTKIAARAEGAAPAPPPAPKKSKPAREKRPATDRTSERELARAADATLAERFTRYRDTLGLDADEADVLSGDRTVSDFFDAALAAHDAPASVAKWVVNVLLGEARDTSLDALPFDAAAFARLVALVDADTLSTTAGKEVLTVLLAEGGDPQAIVDRLGLRQVSDAGSLDPAIEAVLAENGDSVARYRDGKVQLLGFFVGKVMKATGGKANPGLVRELLQKRLAE